MATNINFNGQVFSIPAEGDDGWATALSNYFIAISTGALQKSGGTFSLTSEIDFGNTYGAKIAYLKSKATNPAGAGFLRLGNLETLAWRNNANGADLALSVGADDILKFNNNPIIYSGAGLIVNADIAAGAAIEFTKLQNLLAGELLVGNNLNKATSVSITGAIAINDTGVTSINTNYITDDMISSAAAIVYSKLEVLTANKAVVTGASGFIEASAVTSTELGYLTGVTSAIQTQIDSKAPSAGSVTLSGVETLTNKTLTAPVINSPTGLVKADVGLSNVDNTSDATKNSATVTLTNKTIGDAITLTEIATPSTPAAGLKKLYPKSDGKVYTLNSAGVETAVGTGSGGSGINYILNPDAELNTTGWATYADAAGSIPVDGTGGSPVSTLTRVTTTPLRNTACFLWTKGSANRQGEGFSYDFSIDLADSITPKMMQISFDHLVFSGTYDSGSSSVNSDLIAYIYNVSDGVLIEPAGMKIQAGMPFKATFQTSYSNSSTKQQYRLIIHQSLAGTSAYTMQFDNFSVGPQVTASGYAGSDIVGFTPTGAWSTNTSYSGKWRRVGDCAEIEYELLLSGAPTSATLTLNMPPGMVIDTAKLVNFTADTTQVGSAKIVDSGTASSLAIALVSNSTTLKLYAQNVSGTAPNRLDGPITQSYPIVFAVNDRVQANILVPIVGWSSNTVASSETDTRVISTSATRASAAATISTTIASWTTVQDRNGAFNASTGVYTVKVPGDFYLSATYQMSVTSTSLAAFYNGVNTAVGTVATVGSTGGIVSVLFPNCKVGDTLTLQPTASTTVANATLAIFRLSGPAQITATESVTAIYQSTAATSYLNGPTTYAFATKIKDTHGSFSSNVFTAPVSGTYDIEIQTQFNFLASVGSYITIYAVQTGSVSKNWTLGSLLTGAATNAPALGLQGFAKIPMLTGDTLTIKIQTNQANNAVEYVTAPFNAATLSIVRVGNY